MPTLMKLEYKQYGRALACPDESFFLLGPRGTGKSTWLQQVLPDATLVDLLAYRDYRRAFDDLYYWAPSSTTSSEVDFIAIRDDQVVAIEVKSGAFFNESWCKGLRAFGKRPEVKRRIVVCPDTPDLRLADGIEVISYRRLAEQLHHNALFS